jgi:hypothetical protein
VDRCEQDAVVLHLNWCTVRLVRGVPYDLPDWLTGPNTEGLSIGNGPRWHCDLYADGFNSSAL